MKATDSNENNCDVWIAVLHYQGAENTRACLASVKGLNYRPFKVLITDNCSPDKSGPSLAQEFPEFDFLSLSDNLGFAGGSNAGVNYCISKGAKWIWILNNDTDLDPDSLSKLIEVAERNEKAGVLGAAVFTPTENGFHRSGTGQIDFRKAKTFERGVIDDSQESISCQWLSGCNMLLRAEAFKQMNGFDEDFFLYFEDTDLCWRMNQAGWSCLFVPKAVIKHIGKASTQGKLAIWRSYYYTRNRLLFFMRNCKGMVSALALAAIYGHLFRHTIVLPFRGDDGRRQLKAELLGLSDYLSGKFGKAGCLDF
ncbi:MAG: glycosyltransferase family 2 protein [Candidatus Obscuribacterales bacterium]|nr:glycosyltransferase family 2 protein [Candidatus Obscuribacterales bacterium]